MSDRIDELLADAALIAREAEARTAEWIDRCYQSEERARKAEAERDALLAEHEAWLAFVASGRTMDALTAFERAHDNAERVILG